MNNERIAIVGMACHYPDADSPTRLWENVLAGRRAFRRLPDERMNQADYWSADPTAPDRFYSQRAAVLRDFEFDRGKYRIAGSTYRSTDLAHWLALDVASKALADGGFPDAEGLPKQATGVIIGNSLTGEFSRANLMRLRWPYVRRTVATALVAKGWSEPESNAFLQELEVSYKAPFPAVDEDTLAGGLANTIAGRICNYFDLAGGGYTVDGACSSSLLSVATASKALVDGDIDVAIAGGVDLSIDPFEVIGFAKTGALATGEMRVYDKDSNGFWPGEGCGMLVLMRERDAIDRGARIYASITGWGVSSDGKGGITRPEASGHRLALQRAYRRAGYGVETVSYFEGHGTGTALGDATEIEALSGARRAASPSAPPAALSTVKGNIGHTKAAAGVAGLLKATLAVYHQTIPPATGHYDPNPALLGDSPAMYVPSQAQLWPGDQPVRAGVSAMGFGGINTHIAIEQAPGVQRRTELAKRTLSVVGGRQDAELLLLDGPDLDSVRQRLGELVELTAKIAYAELTDLAGTLAGELADQPVRAAVVAATPQEAARKLGLLIELIDSGEVSVFSPKEGIFLDQRTTRPRIAYLFPGQGSGKGALGAIWRRFPIADEVLRSAGLPTAGNHVATEVAQPRIVAGSLAAMRVLDSVGITAQIAVGHSLGELTSLAWGGAMGGIQLLALAKVRGQVMAQASRGGGGMASLAADPERATALMGGEDVVIAGYNGPYQTVISGPADAVERVCAAAASQGVHATRINVSHAFHSPLVQPAAEAMTERLAEFFFDPVSAAVVSTVTAELVDKQADLRGLLRDQVLDPVRFHQAAQRAIDGADLVLELGPGRVLTDLVSQIDPTAKVLPVDTDSRSLAPLLAVIGAAFTLGAPVDSAVLFTGRVWRPLPLDGSFTFLVNPCETVPTTDIGLSTLDGSAARPVATANGNGNGAASSSTLELLRKLAAERVELPLETVGADTHPLDDLHLSSITVGQIVNEVNRQLGRPALNATTNYATVSLGELADLIDELAGTDQEGAAAGAQVAGVAAWVRPFSVDHVEQPRPAVAATMGVAGSWTVYSGPDHPLAGPVSAALREAGLGGGVLLCVSAGGGEGEVGMFLAAARDVLASPQGTRFVVVQHRLGASGLARTLSLEAPHVPVTVVELAEGMRQDEAVSAVVAETRATNGFSQVRFDADGTRTVPVLTVLPASRHTGGTPLTSADVLLVSGGGKGITAECALAMAQDSGAALGLLGRADPADDAELAANLSRMDAAGVRYRYVRADVTSTEQVKAAVDAVRADLGQVTAILHGAGRNQPSALTSLTEEEFTRTLAPKIDGLRAVLTAVDQDRIKLLITFGSIIGRAGLRGEAHYATANDWMTELTVKFQREHPQARALALEWSVWSGAGMGERLGVVEALMRDGITPISTENGIAVLRQVLADPSAGPVLVVSGRATGLPTLAFEQPELPLTRFVDRVVVHCPGVELITEAELSAGSDLYLNDHLLDGDLLFPAVIGMEAMTQVAAALTGRTGSPELTGVEFLRPVAVRPNGTTLIRVAALVKDAETVEVVIRSEETGFGADHFRARLSTRRTELSTPAPADIDRPALPIVPVDPIAELYGGVLFQGKRFQRLSAYRTASARRAVAEVSTSSPAPWFAPFLPQVLLLADPGTRDTMMHAIQCCVPDATLLPQGVERLVLAEKADQNADYVVLDAQERFQDGDSYTYDLDVRDPSGRLVERWEGLTLRAVRKRDGAGPWVPSLLGPYLERSLERVLGGSRAVVVEPDPVPATGPGTAGRRAQTRLATSRALGRHANIHYRPDGRPEVDGAQVSASHSAGLTLVVAGSGRLGCDVESVAPRAEQDWTALLGKQLTEVRNLLVAEFGEPSDVAGTRLWAALECLRKTGATSTVLTLDRIYPDGWVLLSAGDTSMASWVTTINDRSAPVVFSVLVGKED